MRGLTLISSLLLFSTKVGATMAFSGISGVSNYTVVGSTITVYGGIAGNNTNPAGACQGMAPNLNTPCDSCLATVTTTCLDGNGNEKFPLCACNHSRIYDNLVITVTTTGATANIYVANSTSGSSTTITAVGAPNNTSVSFRWSDVCGVMNGGGSCEGQSYNNPATLTIFSDNKATGGTYTSGDDSFQLTVHVVQADNTTSVYGSQQTLGIGSFIPFPGDEKFYLDKPATSPTFVSPSGSQWIDAMVFISGISLDANNATANNNPIMDPKLLGISTDGTTLAENVVDGLVNGQLYFVRMAMLDQGKNISQYFPDSTATATNPLPTTCTTAPADTCPYAVRPDAVLGMLSKDINCFVATAAYGSSMEPKLDVFRELRKELLVRPWGKRFVLNYYHYGPYAARWIADKPAWRAVARAGLWPLYGFSLIAIRYGLNQAFLFAAAATFFMIAALALAHRRFRARA
jgi:hypothetical protein